MGASQMGRENITQIKQYLCDIKSHLLTMSDSHFQTN